MKTSIIKRTSKWGVAAVLAAILSPALALAHPLPSEAHHDHSSRPHQHESVMHH